MARRIKIDRTKLKEPDEFVSTTQRIITWAMERRRAIIYCLIAVAVVVGATRGVVSYKRSTINRAAILLSQAMRAQFSAAGSAQSQEEALARYTDILRRFPRTPAAPLAKLQAANILYSQERYAEAAAKFTELHRSLPTDHPLRGLVLINLAYCFRESGNLPQAIATARQVLDDESSAARAYAAYALVGWERERGQDAEARKILEFLRENFPNFPLLGRLTEESG